MFSPNLELELLLEQRDSLVIQKETLLKEEGQSNKTLSLAVDILNLDQQIAVVMEECRKDNNV